MLWDFTPRVVELNFKFHFAPMNKSAFDAIVRWLRQMELHYETGSRKPLAEVLTKSMEQGSLSTARCGKDKHGDYIAFTVKGRNRRLVSPAAFCCMRLLALPGSDCEWWFDRSTHKDLPAEKQRRYLKFSRRLGVWGLRILADAKQGQVIRQKVVTPSSEHSGHYDLRHTNLFQTTRTAMRAAGKPMRHTYKGRDAAIQYALKKAGERLGYYGITPDEYAAVLRAAFSLLDRLHGRYIERRR